MKKFKNIFYILLIIAIAIILPFSVFTLITARSPMINGIRSFVILTGSMVPHIPVDAVVYTQTEKRYSVGDIIAFQRGNVTITHRIKQIENKHNAILYQTKGDANSAADIQLVSPSDVQGKVTFILPFVGSFILFLRTLPGFIIFVGSPVLLLVFFEIVNIKNEMEKEIEKKLMKKINNKPAQV